MTISFSARAGVLQAGKTSGEILVQARKEGVVPGGMLGQYGVFRDTINMDHIKAYSAKSGGDKTYKKNTNMPLMLDGETIWGDSPDPIPTNMMVDGWMELYYKFIPASLQTARFGILLAARGDTSISKLLFSV